MTIPIPDYTAPYKPVPNVTPFTLRDGDTMLKKIDYINKYITRSLIPWIDENYALLGDQFETQVNLLIASVNEAIALVIEESVEVSDPIVAELIATVDSQTRIALNAVLSGYYTKAQIDDLFGDIDFTPYYTKTESNSLFETVANVTAGFTARYTKIEANALFATITALNALDARVVVLEALTTGTGRLTQAKMDERYVNEFLNPVAVFIGSSNAEESRGWVADICTRNGWIKKNFSVGGGGFNQPGAPAFYNQTTTAIADTSYVKADVKYVFVVDCSNDTRGKTSVATPAAAVFTLLESNYPNARIIVVPEVFPLTAANHTDTDVMRYAGRIVNELVSVAASYNRVEVINHSQWWFWDNNTWTPGDPVDVHLTSGGYARLRWYIEQYVKFGTEHSNDMGDNTAALDGGVTGAVHSRRIGGVVTTYGTITLAADQTSSIALAALNKGLAPISSMPVALVKQSDGTVKMCELAADGHLNNQIVIPAGTWYFETSYSPL